MNVAIKTEAAAFRIWQYANPIGWNCTNKDVARNIGESSGRVRAVCHIKGWTSRLRASSSTIASLSASEDTYDEVMKIAEIGIE